MGNEKIGFVGAGKMATAFAKGMTAKGFSEKNLMAYDVSVDASANFASATGAVTVSNVTELAVNCDVIVLAVKPNHARQALEPLSRSQIEDKLLVSIMAGVKIDTLIDWSASKRVVRVMPNTPALIGEGASAFACSAEVDDKSKEIVLDMLQAVGVAMEVEEKLLDAVTGLSGSGPAYVFDFIQALADGGVYAGLPRQQALVLAASTVAGAARMVLDTATHPIELKDQVTSPGGTTSRGLMALEEGAFRATVARAVVEATERSRELGNS